MLRAVRPGSDYLIPTSYRSRFEAQGYTMRPAPEGLAEVQLPTPLAQVHALPSSVPGDGVTSPDDAAPPAPETSRNSPRPGRSSGKRVRER
jgi:hypothetical protein